MPKSARVCWPWSGSNERTTRPSSAAWVDRLLSYRVFADAEGKMNLDLRTVSGELLLVSQFTLAAGTGKGLRPGFSGAKAPAEAERLFAHMVKVATERHPATQSGIFAANMQVSLENDGPVTFILR